MKVKRNLISYLLKTGIPIIVSACVLIPLIVLKHYLKNNNYFKIVFGNHVLIYEMLEYVIIPFAIASVIFLCVIVALYFLKFKIFKTLSIIIAAIYVTFIPGHIFVCYIDINFWDSKNWQSTICETNFDKNIVMVYNGGFWVCEEEDNNYVKQLKYLYASRNEYNIENLDSGVKISYPTKHSMESVYFEFVEGHFVSVDNL